jgi:VanZ family protein
VTVISRFAPPLALMALIFFLSAQPDLGTGLGTWDTILRKLAHMAEYGLLWFLWWRALGYGSPLPAIAIALGYAGTDELHQHFVEGRHGTPVDVVIDLAGIAVANALAARRIKRSSGSQAGRAAGGRERRGRTVDSAPARPPSQP